MAVSTTSYDSLIDREWCKRLGFPAGDVDPLKLAELDLASFVAFRPSAADPRASGWGDRGAGAQSAQAPAPDHRPEEQDRRVSRHRPARFSAGGSRLFQGDGRGGRGPAGGLAGEISEGTPQPGGGARNSSPIASARMPSPGRSNRRSAGCGSPGATTWSAPRRSI